MGQYDVPLDAEGKEQCTIVGLELQHFDIDTDKIYTSDLMRAVESSEIIAGFLPSRPEVVALPELREMSLGSWGREIYPGDPGNVSGGVCGPGGKSAHLQNRRRGGEFCAAAGTSDEKGQ